MSKVRNTLIYALLIVAVLGPIAAAAFSPLLAWREPVYIIAGFAGIIAMSMLLLQPLLIGGHIPGLSPMASRAVHRTIGSLLIAAVVIHVVGLWITSPPDVIDALLFVSPTPFSVWGVLAMWAVLLTGILAFLRIRLGITPRAWRILHSLLAAVIVLGSIIHAILITGTMETVSKVAVCAIVVLATVKVFYDLRVWRIKTRRS